MLRIAVIGILVLCVGCNHHVSRGSFSQSQDGLTYLAIMDDNGGACALKVDGKVWRYPIGQAVRIEPGIHTIECGGDLQIEIPRGTNFKFDYWGP